MAASDYRAVGSSYDHEVRLLGTGQFQIVWKVDFWRAGGESVPLSAGLRIPPQTVTFRRSVTEKRAREWAKKWGVAVPRG